MLDQTQQATEEVARVSDALREAKAKFKTFIEDMPLLSPKTIDAKLQALGYRGQEQQRKALALMAYRHIRRIKRLHVEKKDRRHLPAKQNVLMLGPTGCGKTFLVELLFNNIFKLPTVIVDVTSLTESGYVGDDARTVLTRLVAAAEGNLFLASCGVICLDEFDKLASASSSARFAGQGTTKDVSGYGVQRELLAMIEGRNIVVPLDYGYSAYGPRVELSTQDIPFVACGAFSGIEELHRGDQKKFGFGNEHQHVNGFYSEEVGVLQKYGFIPELIGRFSRLVRFAKLPSETLRIILCDNLLPRFQHEFSEEGLELVITEDALAHVVQQAERRNTGARGLESELTSAIEHAAYETFMSNAAAKVVITAQNGGLQSEYFA
ncbi:AAA family ATPase [candidate division KSB1 bacterium]|nr:AAA family ATPase [candidate division KSB1 bacterium]